MSDAATARDGEPRVVSIQVGRPVDYPADPQTGAKAWTSAIDKRTAAPPVTCRTLGLSGDAVANTQDHGGVDKAVLCYPLSHYEHWRTVYPGGDWRGGSFGENISVAGLTEADVCVGDRWRAGDIVLEVSQPRQPCWKLARLHAAPKIVKEAARGGRTGWYVRVIEEGSLAPGPLTLLERPQPDWSVERCNRLLFGGGGSAADVRELFAVPQLAADWKSALG